MDFDSELSSLVQPVLNAIGSMNSVFVDADLISVDGNSALYLSPESMAIAIRVAIPPITFRSSQVLDIIYLIESENLEAEGRDELFHIRNNIAPTVEKCESIVSEHLKARNGDMCRVTHTYANQGLIRHCAINAPWYSELLEILVEFIAGYENRLEQSEINEATKLDALFNALALEIADDERFIHARGLRKKELLVGVVWGDRVPLDYQARLISGDRRL